MSKGRDVVAPSRVLSLHVDNDRDMHKWQLPNSAANAEE